MQILPSPLALGYFSNTCSVWLGKSLGLPIGNLWLCWKAKNALCTLPNFLKKPWKHAITVDSKVQAQWLNAVSPIELVSLGLTLCQSQDVFSVSVVVQSIPDTLSFCVHASRQFCSVYLPKTARFLSFTICALFICVSTCRVLELCRNVKDRVLAECERHGVTLPPLISCRWF